MQTCTRTQIRLLCFFQETYKSSMLRRAVLTRSLPLSRIFRPVEAQSFPLLRLILSPFLPLVVRAQTSSSSVAPRISFSPACSSPRSSAARVRTRAAEERGEEQAGEKLIRGATLLDDVCARTTRGRKGERISLRRGNDWASTGRKIRLSGSERVRTARRSMELL